MPTANDFGVELQRHFVTRSAAAAFGEIAQFRALMGAFGALRPSFHVEEYHGSKHQVYFSTTRRWLRARARCELCDVLIIAFSARPKPQARLTLLQAKLSRSIYTELCSRSATGPVSASFQGNYEQWDLLSARPNLDPTTVFTPPPDLLRAALLPSIGSFGIFHRTESGPIDMFYASADVLTAPASPSGKYGALVAPISPALRSVSGMFERAACCCLTEFGKALLSLQIGTPIKTVADSTTPTDSITRFARSALSALLRSDPGDALLARELLEIIGYEDDKVFGDTTMPSMLILRGRASDA